MSLLIFDWFTLITALILMVQAGREFWLAMGDVAYQHKHGIR